MLKGQVPQVWLLRPLGEGVQEATEGRAAGGRSPRQCRCRAGGTIGGIGLQCCADHEHYTTRVFLNQERVFPSTYDAGAWVLDTAATNHMTGCRASLATLDETVRGAVCFRGGSTVEIYGIDAVTIAGKNQDHRVLTEVYYIPSLKCNIVSLDQLEGGYRIEIDDGVLQVYERCQPMNQQWGILIQAERRNLLYIMKVNLTLPVYLMTKMGEEAWL